MRINRFIASATGLSRRAADNAVRAGLVKVNDDVAYLGQAVTGQDKISFNGQILNFQQFSEQKKTVIIMLNKPVGYVVSRNGQGSKTIYNLLPKEYKALKPVGRLDKDSSGLILLTNDGLLANNLTHPSQRKNKVYEIILNQPLLKPHYQLINSQGVQLEDGISRLSLSRKIGTTQDAWIVTMHEGRNRQIRRTFQKLGYKVTTLHRVQFGNYFIGDLGIGKCREC